MRAGRRGVHCGLVPGDPHPTRPAPGVVDARKESHEWSNIRTRIRPATVHHHHHHHCSCGPDRGGGGGGGGLLYLSRSRASRPPWPPGTAQKRQIDCTSSAGAIKSQGISLVWRVSDVCAIDSMAFVRADVHLVPERQKSLSLPSLGPVDVEWGPGRHGNARPAGRSQPKVAH